MAKKILMIAGESSGDVYGGHLADALKRIYPDAEFTGVGGSRMAQSGVKIIHRIDELAVMGVWEILPKLMVIKNLFRLLAEKIKRERFDLAILVNYPGFNLRFAKILKSKNIPVVFYSSPQVWVWGAWRVKEIKRYVDKMIVFLKLEEAFYKKHGLEAEFVGHPLVDIVRPAGADLGIEKGPDTRIISLVPGSRKNELKTLFATLLESARIIYSENSNVKFLITKHPEIPPEMYLEKMKGYDFPITLVDGKIHDCLRASDMAITVSGSVTLEAAILKVPMMIIYRVAFLTGLLFVIFTRMENIGLVNIIAGKRIMPEFLQYSCRPRRIAREALNILSDKARHSGMKEELERVNNLIGPSGASDRAARSIAKLLG